MFILICISHDEFGVSTVTSKNETMTTDIVRIGDAWTLVLLTWSQVPRWIGCPEHVNWRCHKSSPDFVPCYQNISIVELFVPGRAVPSFQI